jgi:hypothetical protein
MEFTNPQRGVSIRMINNLGQTVYSRSIDTYVYSHVETIDVSNLIPGSYHVKVETAEGQRSMPVVILH